MKKYKIFSYKLEKSKKNNHLNQLINDACLVYNRCIALHQRYYNLFRKYVKGKDIISHFIKIKKLKKYKYIADLYAQTVDDIVYKVDREYFSFFCNKNKNIKASSPAFSKLYDYKSFSLFQNGYEFLGGNTVRIGNNNYKYIKTCGMEGTVKKLTVRRDDIGNMYIDVLCEL